MSAGLKRVASLVPSANANEVGDLITITDLIVWAFPPETVPPLGLALVSAAGRITSTRQKYLEPLRIIHQ